MEEESKKNLWLKCPKCGVRTKNKVYDDTVLLNFPLYCTHCKKEFIVGVLKLKMVVNENQAL